MDRTKNRLEKRVTHDRRKFTYTAYAPERRSGIDRRAVPPKINSKVV